ncbi:ScpA family protein [Tumidithrix elongata RA019]|uniref:Segregation and condensation protein A n=1 Tax=Tumidithrix elongata BACA0141 TaxID=2716417 RepID=A0AAW9QAB0_9CYAN|nr:ScpA family protein [Tumidithrix elongata RA019]
MTQSLTESVTKEAIALLIDLAERGEIDPWDVQVIDIIDRFLSRLIADDRRDLYESGQALLYASMLVLLKANTLSQSQMAYDEAPNDADAEADWLAEDAAGISLARLPSNLEDHIRRRTVAPPPQARRITLDELIAQIEAIALLVEQKSGKSPNNRLRQTKVARKAAMRAITQLAHKENLTEIIIEIENYFMLHTNTAIEISDLAAIFNDRVGVFWGLLFLSAQSKVELFQADFYGKIQIKPLTSNQIQEVS